MLLLGACAQVLLAFPAGPEPVRFGVPLPAAALARGLALRGGGVLQWRRLDLGARAGLVWVEIAVVGGDGMVRVVAGGAAAAGDGHGAAFVRRQDRDGAADADRWSWRDGTEDFCRRAVLQAPRTIDGETFLAGEAVREESPALAERARTGARLPRRVWERAGLLPPDQGLARALRAHLQELAHALVELPGRRGAGDFGRSGGTVTNLEYDTTLALLRLALSLGDETLLLRARRAACHLADHDLDPRSGLPFPHGEDHRTGVPEPGHAWLQGLLWTGAVCADDALLLAARRIACALAANPPAGQGRRDRVRDYAWPLGELEACLQWVDDPVLAAAADRLAQAIARRFDAAQRSFRFGEGELGDGVRLERAWLLGGIVLPALRAHLRRRPDAELERRVAIATQSLLDGIGTAAAGLPTHWHWRAGRVFGVAFALRDAKAALMLEGLPPLDLRRLLRRERLGSALCATPARDDPDLATSLTMVARCAWVYR